MLNLVIGFSGLGSLFRYFWMKKKRRTRSWVGFVLVVVCIGVFGLGIC